MPFGVGLAGLAREQAEQARQVGLERVGGALEHRGAIVGRGRRPGRRALARGGDRMFDIGQRRFDDVADEVVAVGGIANGLRRRGGNATGVAMGLDRIARDHRCRRPARGPARAQGLGQRRQPILVGEIEAARVAPCIAVDVGGQRDRRMRSSDDASPAARFIVGHPLDRRHRVLDQRVDRHRRVGDAIDERRVRAVLEQAAHEIGEQRLVRADRRVDAARPAEAALRDRADDLLVQRLAHAVQALELVAIERRIRAAGELVDRRQRVRVVGRELREHRVGRGQQAPRASEVGDVGVGLPGVDRIAVEALDLGALDLAVPVRSLDESNHQPMAAAAREIDQEVDDERTALLIRLDDEADAVPAGEPRLDAEALEQVERKLEPIRLFGVDVEADVQGATTKRELLQDRIELGVDAPRLRPAVARVQRRELDRDARAGVDAAARRGAADRIDRAFVRTQVARRVVGGERGLAEHVVGMAKPLRLALLRLGERGAYRLAGDELLAHQAHRPIDALSDQRLAALADQASERGREPGLAVRRHQLAGEEQRPRRRIDEQRGAAAEVLVPLAGADLVADEGVARRRIGYPQQRLGEAHQRDPFLR